MQARSVSLTGGNLALRYSHVKRLLDILGAASLLVITAPVQLTIAVLIFANMGAPVLFRQVRPGKDAKPFTILKFRTMHHSKIAIQPKGLDDVTKLGGILRSTSLDELPSLWNVLRGDMSFVGPRPLLMEYLPFYTAEQTRRHEVRPGITGLAQAKGRNLLSWDEKFRFDVEYVNSSNPILDGWILLQTLRLVIGRIGIDSPNEPNSASLPFFGSKHHQK
jgi:lipopolysaccharide/colanic/teichoic acid biosynthesis glycosyltransferase